MNRRARHPEQIAALVTIAIRNPGVLVSDSFGQYATLYKGSVYVLYRTNGHYHGVLRSERLSNPIYYEDYQKAVDGFEWFVTQD